MCFTFLLAILFRCIKNLVILEEHLAGIEHITNTTAKGVQRIEDITNATVESVQRIEHATNATVEDVQQIEHATNSTSESVQRIEHATNSTSESVQHIKHATNATSEGVQQIENICKNTIHGVKRMADALKIHIPKHAAGLFLILYRDSFMMLFISLFVCTYFGQNPKYILFQLFFALIYNAFNFCVPALICYSRLSNFRASTGRDKVKITSIR